ncbi:unnamed protein product [Parascedosporium putredinis]|uniref:HTH TFE/IIEalpha-type domain-containing protein n=1 Tax=Parascedosporium putredinis TaxID=1442378 RepID=A0A9P1M764_9PEZI|nr:unnamed protein product [Parascedosporium putredinis]CAI7989878.1 unnamed protein product [Parascedosporium putredinis]
MDLAQTLLKMVMRAFYDTRQIIAVDAVITHSCLRDDELAYLASLNTKDLHKLVAKLKEERLLHQFNRPEMREGQARPITRIYYYIDYRQTIDAIKWRVYNITKDIQGTAVPANHKDIDDVFARLKAEQERKELEEDEYGSDDEIEDEDEEGDFEDVMATGVNLGLDTPVALSPVSIDVS